MFERRKGEKESRKIYIQKEKNHCAIHRGGIFGPAF
jgi:hypothetical protein